MSPQLTMKLEVVCLPVADIDRAIKFYAEQVGFNLDHDVRPAESTRIVQLTPPGSGCSIVLGTGTGEFDLMQPGSIKGLHLVVGDIVAARSALMDKGVKVEEIVDTGGIKFAAFADPDNNTWTLQEIPPRN